MSSPTLKETRVVVLGSTGQIGRALLKALGSQGVGLSRAQADLTDLDSVLRALDEIRPSALINAAAYTQVDRAETECELAEQVNGKAPGVLAAWARRAGVPFIHYSTDYVFSGKGSRPWTEEDSPAPISVYGQTKLHGETEVQSAGEKFLIFRTSWVYDATGKNFVNTMLKLGIERKTLSVVDDQIGAPTFARDIAQATLQALEQAVTASEFPSGVYHLTQSGETSWYGFAEEIFRLARASGLPLKIEKLIPISTADYPTPAKRPGNSRLNPKKLNQVFGIQLRSWQEALAECLKEKFHDSH